MQPRESALGFASATGVPCDALLRVDGTLPSWLRGTFIHTGPALFDLAAQEDALGQRDRGTSDEGEEEVGELHDSFLE